MSSKIVREEEIKNQLATEFFPKFDCNDILGNIDFAVKYRRDKNLLGFQNLTGLEDEYLLWAEAKRSATDIVEMLAQLVLTIGKARTFEQFMPPPFLGCFDSDKIAFVPYKSVQQIFFQNDFNWNVAPNNRETREFKLVYDLIDKTINGVPFAKYEFNFETEEKELRRFIKENFVVGKGDVTKIEITENNFVHIFHKWIEKVQPTIDIDWKTEAYEYKIYERDFFLADLISEGNKTVENLIVKLQDDFYKTEVKVGKRLFLEVLFKDNGKAYREFWAKYARPPREIYRNEIRERADLLVLPSFRERKGAFFTPQIWVEKSQEYLADVFGETWQDDYYIWDCAAGTGNLLQGLTKPYRVFASTLDSGDVKIMHDDIEQRRSPLLKDHVFQFDFLNDSFDDLPETLQNIIKDERRRKNLIIYINPPYAETNAKKGTAKGVNIGKTGLNLTKQREKYNDFLGKGQRELFAQFMARIYNEISGCKIGMFSKLKALNSPFFVNFRNHFLAKLKKCFIMPASVFDNVKGPFPIGFQVWDTDKKEHFKKIKIDVFDKNGNFLTKKNLYSYENTKYINDWILQYRKKIERRNSIGRIFCVGSDFQHQSYCRLNSQDVPTQAGFTIIDVCLENLIENCVFYAVRKVIPATWLNDRDQFLFPKKKWEKDVEFHNDCLAYTIFSNNISSKQGVNHWIPFEEPEVKARTEYASHILLGFLQGKKIQNAYSDLFDTQEKHLIKREFSAEAQAVFDAGREIWKYYHSRYSIFQKNGISEYNVNASLYDIKWHFKGFTTDKQGKERMNNRSQDEEFNRLEQILSEKLKLLAAKIEPKVYEYEFLK